MLCPRPHQEEESRVPVQARLPVPVCSLRHCPVCATILVTEAFSRSHCHHLSGNDWVWLKAPARCRVTPVPVGKWRTSPGFPVLTPGCPDKPCSWRLETVEVYSQSRYQQEHSLRAPGQVSFFVPSVQWLPGVLGLQLYCSGLCLHRAVTFSPLVSLCPNSCLFLRTSPSDCLPLS